MLKTKTTLIIFIFLAWLVVSHLIRICISGNITGKPRHQVT